MDLLTLAGSKTKKEFIARVRKILDPIGFKEFALHIVGASPDLGVSSIGSEFDRAVFQNALIQQHFANGGGSVMLSSIAAIDPPLKIELFGDIRKAMEASKIIDGVLVSFDVESYKRRAVAGIFRRRNLKADYTIEFLNFVLQGITYFAVDHLPADLLGKYFQLQSKEAARADSKALQMLRVIVEEDLHLKEAAVRQCISLDTANKHIAKARQVLGSRTTAHAVYQALKSGIIP